MLRDVQLVGRAALARAFDYAWNQTMPQPTTAYVRVASPAHQNIRYLELLPRLEGVRGYEYALSSFRSIRGLQHLALRSRSLWRLWLHWIARRHLLLLAADTAGATWMDMVNLFPGAVVVDLDDPTLSVTEIAALNSRRVKCVFVTTAEAKSALFQLGVRTEVVVVPQCVPDSWLDSPPRLPREPDHPIVVGVAQPFLCLNEGPGTNTQNYRIDLLLDALSAARGAGAPVNLELIGRASRSLRDRITGTSWIVHRGYVAHRDLPSIMRGWDIGAYPRLVDWKVRSSIKILEYMALGLPVIATNVAEAAPVVDAGAGLIATDQGEWIQAVCRLAGDVSLRESLGGAGRRYAARYAATEVAIAFSGELQRVLRRLGERSAACA